MTDAQSAKKKVLAVYPDAFVDWFLTTFEYVIWNCDYPSQTVVGRGPKRYAAWEDAASKLPVESRKEAP